LLEPTVPSAPTLSLARDPHAVHNAQTDITLSGSVGSADSHKNLIVEFYVDDVSIGQTDVRPDGTFEFTPYGLPFVTSPGDVYNIDAKVVSWNYVKGKAEVSTAATKTIEEFLSIADACTDPNITGCIS